MDTIGFECPERDKCRAAEERNGGSLIGIIVVFIIGAVMGMAFLSVLR